MPTKPEPKPSGKDDEGQGDERESHKILARIHELKALLTNKKPSDETPKPNDALEHKRNRRPLWIGAGITLIYCIVSFAQWLTLRESNRINRDALVSVQRAFITSVTVEVKGTIDKGGGPHKWQFNAAAENSGTTPAENVYKFFDMDQVTEPTPEAFKGTHRGYDSFVGPKHGLKWGHHPRDDMFVFGKVIPENEPVPIEIYTNAKVAFWGWVVYHDVFPETPWHLTEFCQTLQSIDVADHAARTNTQSCNEHNCEDKYCKDYEEITRWAVYGK